VHTFAPRIQFLKPGQVLDKAGHKTKRVKMRGMINGSEAMKIIHNRQSLLEAAKVAPNFSEKLAR
jgi:hypothetical protein